MVPASDGASKIELSFSAGLGLSSSRSIPLRPRPAFSHGIREDIMDNIKDRSTIVATDIVRYLRGQETITCDALPTVLGDAVNHISNMIEAWAGGGRTATAPPRRQSRLCMVALDMYFYHHWQWLRPLV